MKRILNCGRLYERREPLGAALASLSTDIRPLSAEEYEATRQSLAVLRPFSHATVELSEEKRVAGSKAIPLIKMLKICIAGQCGQMTHGIGAKLANNLKMNLADKFHQLEKVTALSVATLLDPRFKEVGFYTQGDSQAAIYPHLFTESQHECGQKVPQTKRQDRPSVDVS